MPLYITPVGSTLGEKNPAHGRTGSSENMGALIKAGYTVHCRTGTVATLAQDHPNWVMDLKLNR